MDKRTLELLHSKLSDLDSKIAEISSLRQQIFDILKEHESQQQAAQDAAALVGETPQTSESSPKDETVSNEAAEQLDLAQIQTKVDETVQQNQEEDDDAIDAISDIDTPEDVEQDAQKAKEDIEREAISLEAEKLMESAPDDVEPMRKAEESLEDDIENADSSDTVEMVNNPETISTIDPTIIPQKVLDEDLDVGKDSDLAKVEDAFAEMDDIESQADIDKMEQQLSFTADEEEKEVEDQAQAPAQVQETVTASENKPEEVEVKAQEKVLDKAEPAVETPTEKVEEKVEVPTQEKVEENVEALADVIKTPEDSTVEEEAVIVQPRPVQQSATTTINHPSNQGTLNAVRPSAGMKVDEMLSRQNSRNLYKAFTLNDKFRFRRELFHGKDIEMAEALDRISLMDNFSQAEDYFYDTLGLNPNNEDVKDFMMIIQNHFDL